MIGLCVGLCVAGGCLWAVSGKTGQRRAALAPAEIDPTSLPWLEPAVDTMIWSGLQNGMDNPEELAAFVARWVYPVSASGQRVMWPPSPGAPPIYNRIYQRILVRVHWTLANAAERAAGG